MRRLTPRLLAACLALCLLAPASAQSSATWELAEDEINSALRSLREAVDADRDEAIRLALLDARSGLLDSLVDERAANDTLRDDLSRARLALQPLADSLAARSSERDAAIRRAESAEANLDSLRARILDALGLRQHLSGALASDAETTHTMATVDYEAHQIANRSALGGLSTVPTLLRADSVLVAGLIAEIGGPYVPAPEPDPTPEPEPEPEPVTAFQPARWTRGANTTATLTGDVLTLTMPASGATWFIQPVPPGRYVLQMRGSGYVRVYDKSALEVETTLTGDWQRFDLDLGVNVNIDNFGDGALDAETRLRRAISP